MKFTMSNKVYDFLKYIALVALPAIATFYAGLSKIWSLPYPVEIPGTIMLVDTLLGALLKISSDKYKEEQEELAKE